MMELKDRAVGLGDGDDGGGSRFGGDRAQDRVVALGDADNGDTGLRVTEPRMGWWRWMGGSAGAGSAGGVRLRPWGWDRCGERSCLGVLLCPPTLG